MFFRKPEQRQKSRFYTHIHSRKVSVTVVITQLLLSFGLISCVSSYQSMLQSAHGYKIMCQREGCIGFLHNFLGRNCVRSSYIRTWKTQKPKNPKLKNFFKTRFFSDMLRSHSRNFHKTGDKMQVIPGVGRGNGFITVDAYIQ